MKLAYTETIQMDVCDAPDIETFHAEYGKRNVPVLIKNATKSWSAMSNWTFDYFSLKYPDTYVRVVRIDNSEAKVMSVSQYFDYMVNTTEPNPYYLKDWTFEDDCPELMKDYEVPGYFNNWLDYMDPADRPKLRWLYIGPRNSGSAMHLDTMDTSAWNAVISGKKRWLFFPPECSDQVYNGTVDAFDPDFERFPALSRAKPIYVEQGPGDIVFTPTGYWHQVHNEQPGISITENFINETNFKQVEAYFIRENMNDELQSLYYFRDKVAL